MFNDAKLLAIHHEGDFITSDKFLNFCLQNKESYLYLKTDLIFKGGRWRNAYVNPTWLNLNVYQKCIFLGHSDADISKTKVAFLKLLGAKYIFGSNLQSHNKDTFYIPLGLTNDSHESNVHDILGNDKLLSKVYLSHKNPSFSNLTFYRNYTRSTNQESRGYLDSILLNSQIQKHVYSSETVVSNLGRLNFLQEIRSIGLVLCPRGNGYDTHRIWEVLYLGGIPIVSRKELPLKFPNSKELPIIILDDWTNLLDLKLVSNKVEKIINSSHDISTISFKSQIQFIKSMK